MILESLDVKNIMGCDYSIDFDPNYTVIIGNNRQGKTLTARQIMLALYGTGSREKDLHDSWKLRSDELIPHGDRGSVELVFSVGIRRFKIIREFGKIKKAELYSQKNGSWEMIFRTDTEVKSGLEEDAGLTPGLMNVVMSNEQNLIGTISYDTGLQANVWEGWRWRTEIIRGNIKKARNKCSKVEGTLNGEINDLNESIESIARNWIDEGIFSEEESEERISDKKLEDKIESIQKEIDECGKKIKHYREFYNDLIKYDELEKESILKKIIEGCKEKKKHLDEKEDIEKLKSTCEQYQKTLTKVNKKGGDEGIQEKIRTLDDESKKLSSAKNLGQRQGKPYSVECNIFPPETGKSLVVEIPDKIATKFKYEEIAEGGIAVPYDEQKESDILNNIKQLNELVEKYNNEKIEFKQKRDTLREQINDKKESLDENEQRLNQQKTILKTDRKHYIDDFKNIQVKEKLARRLNIAKSWFNDLNNAMSEEESLLKIRRETIAFINRIYENVYNWDINAKLEGDDSIVITDAQGNIRSHPSGSEIHILGLAWRWMIARSFDLPLVLDELDVLLDEKNFERTKKLIEEEMDRQTVILTLKESLSELPGKIYRIVREEGLSSVEEIK